MYLAGVCMLTVGCSALKDSAVDYIKQEAIDQISESVDKRLEQRGLSLAQLKDLADEDKSGSVNTSEILSTVKETAKDFIALQIEKKSEEARTQLEDKFHAVASARDFDELKKVAQDQDLFGKSTLAALITAIIGYVTKQVFSAKADGKRDARLAVLEQLVQRDLDGDGVIGPANVQPEQPAT